MPTGCDSQGEVRVVAFRPEHAEAFRALNILWIERFFAIEAKDLEVLDHPQRNIIDKGGAIFIAEADGAIVGCCALLALADGGFELAKMTVDETRRGTGTGGLLIEAAKAFAIQQGAPRLYLESNAVLGPALRLYERMGFAHLPAACRPQSPYARCDVFMEMPL